MPYIPAPQNGRLEDLAQAVGEQPVAFVPGVGATLVVTPTRVCIVRDSANLRPRSGLRAWPHGSLDVRLEPPKHGSGRIVLKASHPTGPRDAVSVFVPVELWSAAEEVAVQLRRQAVRARSAGGVLPGDGALPRPLPVTSSG